MDQLRRLGDSISVSIPPDENGFMGRECPEPDCDGYFKIQSGTGIKGDGLPCHCPYCGHSAGHDQFWTKEQIEYAKSVALRKVTDAFRKDLKKLEFEHKPRGAFGIGISMKVYLADLHRFTTIGKSGLRPKSPATTVRWDTRSHDYISNTGDAGAVIGRKVTVEVDEVRTLARVIRDLAPRVSESLKRMKKI